MMKKFFLAVFFCALYSLSFSQDTARASQLVAEGIALHDNSKYAEAVAKYREALLAAPDYPRALYEMSYTYYATGKLDSSALLGEKLLQMNTSDDIRKQIYVTLGSVYDENKQPDKAEDIYKQGIKKYPDFYLLYFNLGITKYGRNPQDVESAQELFEKALFINPFHTGSHYSLYKIMANNNKIAAMLSASMLCILEQKTKRSNDCAFFIQNALMPKVESDSARKNITIYLPAGNDKLKENNFSSVEMALSLLAASPQIIDTLQMKTPEQKLDFQYQMFCDMMGESKKSKGFFWKYYGPFFSELKKKNFTTILVHRVLSNTNPASEDWLNNNQDKVTDFYDWEKNYSWYKEK